MFGSKKLLTIGLLAVLVLSVVSAAGAAPLTSKQILAQIQKKHSGIRDIQANYTRTTASVATEGIFESTSQQTATGILKFKKPAKLSLDQATPRSEKMVTDGSTVWWYMPTEKLVHRYIKVDLYGELKPLLDFLNGLGSLGGSFSVKVTPAGTGKETDHRLDLKRLKEGTGPHGITVWFSAGDYSMVRFRMESLTGETTTFSLKNVRFNQGLPDKDFVFVIPPGTEVIEESGS